MLFIFLPMYLELLKIHIKLYFFLIVPIFVFRLFYLNFFHFIDFIIFIFRFSLKYFEAINYYFF